MIVLPGGSKGVENLEASETLIEMLKKHQEQNGWIAAICAGPMILGKLGFLNGIKATCYPGCETELKDAVCSEENAVVDKNFITGRGPGVTLDFALPFFLLLKGMKLRKN